MNFSIITASYNAASTINGCLDSVRSQTLLGIYGDRPTVEHIIIDGGSTDSTMLITQQYPHISHKVSEPDSGLYDAMNKGLHLATGQVIGILNADDFYANNGVLKKVIKVFENSDIDACYGDLLYVKEQVTENYEHVTAFTSKRILHNYNFQTARYWKSGSFQPGRFYWGWMPPHPTFFVRRSVYEKYGLFNLDLGSAADYELMLRFLLRHRINVVYIPEVLVKMRVGGVSNANLKNRLRANQMDRKAWEVNGLKPYPWTLWMKPLRKIPQWWQRPSKNQF